MWIENISPIQTTKQQNETLRVDWRAERCGGACRGVSDKVEELIPETQEGKHSNVGTIGFAVGFLMMMVLDVLLG